MLKVLVTSILLVASTQAFALDGTLSTSSGRSGSSRDNRQNMHVMVVANPLGIGPSGGIEQGGGIGVFLGRDTILQIEVGDGNTSTEFLEQVTKKHTNSASLNLKHFVGNSFYIKGGLDHRHIRVHEYDAYPSNGASPLYYEFGADVVAAGLVIGNQWQWSGFTLGCDWFGVSQPVSKKFIDERASSESDAKSMRKAQTDYVASVALQGLRLYLGASF